MVYPTPGFVVRSTFLDFVPESVDEGQEPKPKQKLQRARSDSALHRHEKEPEIFGSQEMRELWESKRSSTATPSVHPWSAEEQSQQTSGKPLRVNAMKCKKLPTTLTSNTVDTTAGNPDIGTQIDLEHPMLTAHDEVCEPEGTALQLDLVPLESTRQHLADTLDACGFQGRYDFVYLPMDLRTRQPLKGHAIVNFVSLGDTAEALTKFSERASPYQHCKTLEDLVERYRNSPVMHSAVPDAYKPKLYKNGSPIAFPPATARIRIPRLRGNTHKPFTCPGSGYDDLAPTQRTPLDAPKDKLDVWFVDLLASNAVHNARAGPVQASQLSAVGTANLV